MKNKVLKANINPIMNTNILKNIHFTNYIIY